MARATDDERRLIEGRLRELAGRKGPYEIDCRLAEAVMGHDFCETPCDGCLSTVLTRLADLIEPGDTSLSCRDTVACDREALLALAEEMDRWALTCDHYDRQVSPLDVARYARRIREACGVVES